MPKSYSFGTSTGHTPAHSFIQPLQELFIDTTLLARAPATEKLPTLPSIVEDLSICDEGDIGVIEDLRHFGRKDAD